ncbi:hypothetical protein LY624_15070 [Pseudoalteromonas sp. N1230-9]|uniref:hypothetical protein n=1 Tax=Pseudoalteromonas sp. N1230-9 TaxID=2907156 RepID=UPI002B3006C6|nr:hypothetical protein LY624_15070 [Pseudoalteromonas sp. N1230-9]
MAKLMVEKSNGVSKMVVDHSETQEQTIANSQSKGKLQAYVLAYRLTKELKNKQILIDGIHQTIGWIESTGGCEESIRMLRKALSEVRS